jgi:selenium-binding protein 1
VFDVGANPAKPKLVRTITDLSAKSGYVGPHTFYAMPGRILIGALSNAKDSGGVTGVALYNNKGEFVAKYDLPTTEIGGVKGDGDGYDIAINPSKNAMLNSSFTGIANYRRKLGDLVKDAEAMKRLGNTMVLWDVKAMRPTQIFAVPGAPLEIRWSLKPGDNWAITATALSSKLWLVRQDAKGAWRVYITSSLLERWDKTGEDNEQFLRAFHWDGKELTPAFEVDFTQEKLGRAHHMKFSRTTR